MYHRPDELESRICDLAKTLVRKSGYDDFVL